MAGQDFFIYFFHVPDTGKYPIKMWKECVRVEVVVGV